MKTDNMQDHTHILPSVLDLVDYQGDKNEFVKKYEVAVVKETLSMVYQQLPENTKEPFRKMISDQSPPQDVSTLTKNFIDDQALQNTIVKASEATFLKFIESITPSLNDAQSQKLEDFLTSLNNYPQDL